MSATIVAATADLKKVYKVLAADIEEARSYGQSNPTGYAHRALFRAAFALIDGLSFQFRAVSLACAEAMPQVLDNSEVSLLREEKYRLSRKGIPETTSEYQQLLPSILFSMRCYAKVHGATFEPELGHHGCESMKKFVAIRNSIEHPKAVSDLEYTDTNLRHAMEAMTWWKRQVLNLLDICREADEKAGGDENAGGGQGAGSARWISGLAINHP
jgi:hypothetical protein